jgi:hypothetical protein
MINTSTVVEGQAAQKKGTYIKETLKSESNFSIISSKIDDGTEDLANQSVGAESSFEHLS